MLGWRIWEQEAELGGGLRNSLNIISLNFLAPSGEPNKTVIKFSLLSEGPGTRHGIPVLSSLWEERQDKRPLRRVLSYDLINIFGSLSSVTYTHTQKQQS